MASAQALKAALEKEVDAYKSIQKEIQQNITTRQQLLSQKSENEMVIEELGRLDDDGNVYKLIGPCMIKQDLVEAKSNVQKRIEYITGELDRLDVQMKSLEGKSTDRQQEIAKIQKKLQATAGQS